MAIIMRIRSLILYISLLISMPSIAASNEKPTDIELKRFIVAYRIDKVSIREFQYAAQLEEQRGNTTKAQLLRCVSDGLSRQDMISIFVPLAQESFSDSKNVSTTISFLESRVGQKLLNNAEENLKQVGFEQAQPASDRNNQISYSSDELPILQAFEKSSAYPEWKHFALGIEKIRQQDAYRQVIRNVSQNCRGLLQ